VTVVFLDLRGFTAFAEVAEPEDVMSVLREYHARMGELIVAHGQSWGLLGVDTCAHAPWQTPLELQIPVSPHVSMPGQPVQNEYGGLISLRGSGFGGLMYLAGGMLWRDVPQYVLGVWMLVSAAGSVLAGVPGNFLVLAFAGGGGMLVLSAYYTVRRRG